MRRIKNHKVSINNPALMFAQGLESLISDPLYSRSRGNLFGVLLKQFANF